MDGAVHGPRSLDKFMFLAGRQMFFELAKGRQVSIAHRPVQEIHAGLPRSGCRRAMIQMAVIVRIGSSARSIELFCREVYRTTPFSELLVGDSNSFGRANISRETFLCVFRGPLKPRTTAGFARFRAGPGISPRRHISPVFFAGVDIRTLASSILERPKGEGEIMRSAVLRSFIASMFAALGIWMSVAVPSTLQAADSPGS